MLQDLDDEGTMRWHCGKSGCAYHMSTGKMQEAHVTHEAVRFHLFPGAPKHHRTAELPECASCGARTFLKVDFTPDELSASNMLDETGRHTASHAAAHRHMALARRMEELGKVPVQQQEPEQEIHNG